MESYASGTVPLRRSVITIPIDIRISALENTLNQQLEGVMYEDNDLRDGDRMMIKATKADRIKVRMEGQQFFFSLPASLWVKYDAGITVVEASGKIAMDINTTYSVKPDWSIATQTQISGHRWLQKPVLKVVGVNLPVGLLADLVLQNTKRRITRAIDQAVSQNFGLGAIVQQTWDTLFQPSLVSPEYGAWLLVDPQAIGMTPIRVNEDTLSTSLIVEAKPRVVLGNQPPNLQPRPLPAFTQFNYQVPGFEVHLGASVPFAEAQRLAKQEVEGQTYTVGKRAVTIQDIELFGQDGQLVVNLRMTGSYNGNVYLKGKPVFNVAANAVEVQDLDFTLDTRNFLLKSGTWLLKSTLRKRLQETMDFYLKYNLGASRKALEDQLNAFNLAPGFHLQAKVDQLDIGGVALQKEGFLIDVKLSGDVRIRNF
ncbi:MAG: DUF4403 family protein [Haliscomenobacter sp.]|nr:DUF4403 family protein [Haliscomenobacter sp.]